MNRVLLVPFLALLAAYSQALEAKRHVPSRAFALLIGSDFGPTDPGYPSERNDVRRMREALLRIGVDSSDIDSSLVGQLTKEEIENEIALVRQKIEGEHVENVYLYVSGHGYPKPVEGADKLDIQLQLSENVNDGFSWARFFRLLHVPVYTHIFFLPDT